MLFKRGVRAFSLHFCQARTVTCLIIVGWLAFAQPGKSYYWLIDPEIHEQIDAELYGQRPDGETLPGHEHRPPHDHPITPGISVPDLTLANPFGAAFYCALLSPAQRLALLDQPVELDAIAQPVTIDPPDQPPRPTP